MLNVSKIEQQIQYQVDSGDILGLAVAIIQRDEITYARGFGLTTVEDEPTRVTPNTLFAFGSICTIRSWACRPKALSLCRRRSLLT